jgi:NADH:ubiquinone oxidoreductase subunit 3 (subunit A)
LATFVTNAARLRGVRERKRMLNDYVFIGLFMLIAVVFPGLPIAIAWVVRPRKPNPLKNETYECGIETVGDTWVQFKVQYYIFALVFLVFDVETLFLLPWAVAYGALEMYMVLEMVLFILILAAGLLYTWRRGELEWQ